MGEIPEEAPALAEPGPLKRRIPAPDASLDGQIQYLTPFPIDSGCTYFEVGAQGPAYISMSDTTETAVRRLRQDSPTVDAVCRQLQRSVDAAEADLAVQFAEILFSKASADFLRERSIDALASLALGVLRFLQESRPEQVDVQVVNPELATEGWEAPVTVIRTNVTERPFVVDTIREFLHSQELAIDHMIYPVLTVWRNERGEVTSVSTSERGDARESLVHVEVSQVNDPERLAFIREELTRRLRNVKDATDDFPAMTDAVNNVVAGLAERTADLADRREEMEEIQAFLRWLRDGGFVFLGYRGYDLVDHDDGRGVCISVTRGSGLGVLRAEQTSSFATPVPVTELDEGLQERVLGGPLLIISKTNAESTIHRRARMDYIGVKKLGPNGEAVGEHRFIGLFTSRAYAEEAEKIPILRRKLEWILQNAGVKEGSHDYKEIITIFNSLPKEELFLASMEEVGQDVHLVLTSYHSAAVRVTLREDPLHRGVSVMVILPKDRFSGDVRRALEVALVQAFEGEVLNYHLALGEGDQARLHFYMAAPASSLARVKPEEVEALVGEIIRSWADRVREGLERVLPSDEARRLARRYGEGFSAEYQAATDPAIAVEDLLELESMEAEGRAISISFANRGTSVAAPGVEGVTELKVYLRGERLILSDFMPILEHLGLRVIAVNPFDVRGGGVSRATVYVFGVQDQAEQPLDIDARGELLADAVLSVRAGDAVNDDLNALVLGAGLHWREVDVLRAYGGYAFQSGAVPSRLSLLSAMGKYPGIARELFDLFQIRFDPASGLAADERKKAAEDVQGAIQASLRGVSLLADDRVFRRLKELICATLRTNYYRNGGRSPSRRSGGVPYVSFKFATSALDYLRPTRVKYEVWVHSSRMEGVHLRGANVARGGIRWSDRPDDFRTEIMGLVRTQMVKNAVIVPGGSKGGFITRRTFQDPEERFKEAKSQYRTLVRGLLDITDNLDAEGATVAPEDVVCYDAPDPYLVVAADKGTATFSDLANAVSAEYGFWLDDAFASGGSNGYDHKAVGITARGGWECVKRHFREKGKNIQAEPFTVVGIGDMSGDVFGNGMLLSEQIRLVAAFDHRHVFIDPDPDPASTFAERKRIFEMGRSSWADYDTSLLSAGGMIVPRGSKEVELTAEAKRALGLPEDVGVMDGETLIRAVLKAPVELLWNGGIGTYVKADFETHADAGDSSNDAVRVDVSELRCEVIGEGGNLGLTQRARIAYALEGGRINTDAMDNSGGVDMSDHEVNLKILLAPAVASGKLSQDERNTLLEELTESVADLVLENNRTQSLAISLDEVRCRESMDDFRDLMTALETNGELDRASEALPSMEVLVDRKERGASLTRPELCVLLAYSKLSLKGKILRSDLTDATVAQTYLRDYFPPAALNAAGEENLKAHRLRSEIIAGQITNDLVDIMGATFVNRVARDTGRDPADVVRAWLVASQLAGHGELMEEMGRQQSAMNARVAYRWVLGLSRVLERTTRWVLHNVKEGTSATEVVEANFDGVQSLRAGFPALVDGEDRALFESRVKEVLELGADRAFSENLIVLRFLDQLLEILDISREVGGEPGVAGQAYYALSASLDVPWLRRTIFASAGEGVWEQRAAQALAEDVSRAHRLITIAVIRREGEAGDVEPALAQVLESSRREVDRYRGILAELRAEDVMTLSAASVAARELVSLSLKIQGG